MRYSPGSRVIQIWKVLTHVAVMLQVESTSTSNRPQIVDINVAKSKEYGSLPSPSILTQSINPHPIYQSTTRLAQLAPPTSTTKSSRDTIPVPPSQTRHFHEHIYQYVPAPPYVRNNPSSRTD